MLIFSLRRVIRQRWKLGTVKTSKGSLGRSLITAEINTVTRDCNSIRTLRASLDPDKTLTRFVIKTQLVCFSQFDLDKEFQFDLNVCKQRKENTFMTFSSTRGLSCPLLLIFSQTRQLPIMFAMFGINTLLPNLGSHLGFFFFFFFIFGSFLVFFFFFFCNLSHLGFLSLLFFFIYKYSATQLLCLIIESATVNS